MPIIKSAKKQLRQSRKKNERNTATKNRAKNATKDFLSTLAENKAEAQKKFPEVQKIIDTAAKKKVISKRRAARNISSLNRQLNSAK